MQHLHDIRCGDRTRTVDRQALTGILLEPCQAFQPPTICGLGMDNILAPDLRGMRRPGWRGRACAHRMSFLLLLPYLESFVLSDAADALAISPPLFPLQEGIALPLAKARIPLREPINRLDQYDLAQLA